MFSFTQEDEPGHFTAVCCAEDNILYTGTNQGEWPAAKNEGSGKIHFLRPEFLGLPLFVRKRSRDFLDLW